MKSAIIATLIALLVPPKQQEHNKESEDAARDRYTMIADAIADEAPTRQAALFLIAIARHESTFAKSVHSGKRKGDGGLAWGLFQINIGSTRGTTKIPRTEYRLADIVGVDEEHTHNAVRVALLWLMPAIKRCRGNARCVFARYGGLSAKEANKPKRRKQLDARAATYHRLEATSKK